jgi:hypothetical protein
MYRIDVPADALRWKHTSTHPADVLFTLFPGTVPAVNQTPLWASRGQSHPFDPIPNASLNQSLASQVWPWAPAQSFYLVVSNASASVQAFTLNMDGRNASNEDGDEDGVLDAWEVTTATAIRTGMACPTGWSSPPAPTRTTTPRTSRR